MFFDCDFNLQYYIYVSYFISWNSYTALQGSNNNIVQLNDKLKSFIRKFEL
jgi:hypothetical protein